MIASRIADLEGRATATVNVNTITGSAVYGNLTASHQQVKAQEAAGPLGEMATVIHDVFYFDRLTSTGALPVILEKHVISWNSVDYEVISARSLDELAQKLRVETKRVR